MDIFEFMIESPWLSAFLAILVFLLLGGVMKLMCGLVNLVNRFIRHLNLRKCGWPPEHCDADGDTVNPFKK